MIITDIVPKRKRLCALYIDGEFALKLDSETVLASRFSVGSEISDEELRELIQSSDEKRAKEKALWLLSSRDHSSRELKVKLGRDCTEESACKAVERMEELGLVDDEKFARRYARELIFNRHYSARGARYKLCEKGIDRELADIITEELSPDPRENIEALLSTKYARSLSDEKGRRRVVSALQRLGYSWEDIRAALSNFSEEDNI